MNTIELLSAAAYQFFGNIDDERLIGSIEESGDRRVLRLMEGVFHDEGGKEVGVNQGTSGEWCDIDEESYELMAGRLTSKDGRDQRKRGFSKW